MKQLRYNDLTPAQAKAAKSFAEEHPTMSVSQCAKYLQYIFAYKRDEITAEQFKKETGWDATPFKKF